MKIEQLIDYRAVLIYRDVFRYWYFVTLGIAYFLLLIFTNYNTPNTFLSKIHLQIHLCIIAPDNFQLITFSDFTFNKWVIRVIKAC